jgi:TusA-related sulfurtransferase
MPERFLDCRGLKCPMPIIKAKKELAEPAVGDVLKVVATDKGSVLDFQGWARQNAGFALVGQREEKDDTGRDVYVHLLAKQA